MSTLYLPGLDSLKPLAPKPSAREASQLLERIDRIAGLQGVRVVFHDGITAHELRPHPPICQPNYLTVVIRATAKQTREVISHPSAEIRRRDGRFASELSSGVVGCGAAALAWMVIGGSGAAIPFTAGVSGAVTVLAWSAALASSTQCGASILRTVGELSESGRENNDWLDSQGWYRQASIALDVISVAGAVASVGATLRMALTLRRGGTTGREVLKGLSRQQRRQLTKEVIAAQNPNLTAKQIKGLVRTGVFPKRFGKFDLSNTVKLQLYDAVGATLSFSGSAMGGVIRSPSKLQDFAIAVFEEFEVY